MDMSLSKHREFGDGQGSLACYSPWGRKESDMTEWLNWIDRFRRLTLKFWRRIQLLKWYQLCVSPRKMIKTFSILTWVYITDLCLKCFRHSRGTVICLEPTISCISMGHSPFYLTFTTIYHSAVCQQDTYNEMQGSSWRCLRKCWMLEEILRNSEWPQLGKTQARQKYTLTEECRSPEWGGT